VHILALGLSELVLVHGVVCLPSRYTPEWQSHPLEAQATTRMMEWLDDADLQLEMRGSDRSDVEEIIQKLVDAQRGSVFEGSFVAPGDKIDTYGEEGFLR